MTPSQTRTLSHELAQAKLPVPEALRVAVSLAEALRRIHDDGHIHGALTPSRIALTSSGVELLPPPGGPFEVTAYTAPEVLSGAPADVRSDIFSFGAIVYELISGHAPFSGDTPDALKNAVLHTPAPPTGSRALDGLLANCLAKEPAARSQRMQRVQMELKLVTVSARRTETPAHRDNLAALVRAELQQAFATRLTPRLDAQDKAISDFQQAVGASLQSLQAHLCTIDAKLAAAQETAARAEGGMTKLDLRVATVEDREAVSPERIGGIEVLLQTATERTSRAEQTTEAVRNQAAAFAETAAAQLHALEQTVRAQADALESARTALAQTDDLVERVVEALDSLQSIVLEHAEDRPSDVG
jgi:chromosome segregation ATPase